MKIVVPTPPHFNYQATVDSHGWRNLAPFQYSAETRQLRRVHQLTDGSIVQLMFSGDEGVTVMVEGLPEVTPLQKNEIIAVATRIFSMRWDLQLFYDAMRPRSQYIWMEEQGLGRILVSPTVWEDLVKILFTTNTTWSQTIAMTGRFCELGEKYEHGGYAFPTPEAIAEMPLDDLSKHIRVGYRAPYVYELAYRIASGEIDVERWYHEPIASDELYKAIKALKGFGDYAAGTMLRLLGYFDRIAIDTACRTAYKQLNNCETAHNKDIEAYYEPFGDWRGLVMWMDVMRS